MKRVRHFLETTPFVRYAIVTAFLLLVGYHFTVWAGHQARTYTREVLVPRAEAYVYAKLLPKVMEQAQKAVQEGIRNGADGALGDLTGGLIGGKRNQGPAGALTITPGPDTNGGVDPCRAPGRSPGFPLRLPFP